jgi:hypothetical protein
MDGTLETITDFHRFECLTFHYCVCIVHARPMSMSIYTQVHTVIAISFYLYINASLDCPSQMRSAGCTMWASYAS